MCFLGSRLTLSRDYHKIFRACDAKIAYLKSSEGCLSLPDCHYQYTKRNAENLQPLRISSESADCQRAAFLVQAIWGRWETTPFYFSLRLTFWINFGIELLGYIEMGYTMIICFDSETNNLACNRFGIYRDNSRYSRDVPYCPIGIIPCRTRPPGLAAWPGCFLLVHVAWPRLAPSCSTTIILSAASVTDRTPQTRVASPKLPQPWVYLEVVASPPAWLLGCVRAAVWE